MKTIERLFIIFGSSDFLPNSCKTAFEDRVCYLKTTRKKRLNYAAFGSWETISRRDYNIEKW